MALPNTEYAISTDPTHDIDSGNPRINKYLSKCSETQRSQFLSNLERLISLENKLQSELFKFKNLEDRIISSLQTIIDSNSGDRAIANACNRLGSYLFQIRRIITYISAEKVKLFEEELSGLTADTLPIITRVFVRVSLQRAGGKILFFMGNFINYHNILSYDQWKESEFVDQLLLKLHNEQYAISSKRDVLRCLANMASAAANDESLKRLFNEQDAIESIATYTIQNVLSTERDEHDKYPLLFGVNRAQLLFPFRIISFLSDSDNNDRCKWLLHNTYALQWLLEEYDCALKGEGIRQGNVTFYPDVWDRSMSINKLYDDHDDELKQILLSECGIVQYLARSLVFEEKTLHERGTLYQNVCECLCKISTDWNNLDVLFQYQFQCFPSVSRDHGQDEEELGDLWSRLQWIMHSALEFECAAKYAAELQQNVRNHYLDVFQQHSLMNCLPNELMVEISSWIW